MLDRGDGTFHASARLATGLSPAAVATADFNGDGIPDLAIADAGDKCNAYYGQLLAQKLRGI